MKVGIIILSLCFIVFIAELFGMFPAYTCTHWIAQNTTLEFDDQTSVTTVHACDHYIWHWWRI